MVQKEEYPVSELSQQKHLVGKRGQRKMTSLVWTDKKTMLTPLYNRGEKKSMSDCTCQTPTWIGYNSSWPCQAPLLTAKNTNQGVQWEKGSPKLDSWNLGGGKEREKKHSSGETSFFVSAEAADGGCRILHPLHGSMGPACAVLSFQADGNTLLG